MILFEDIYNRAVVLFDDPKITSAYELNKIVFCKYMYGYLQNVAIFEPIFIGQQLSANTIPPKGELELIEGDGEHDTFTLQINIPENSIICFTEAGEDAPEASYDAVTKQVKFPHVLGPGEEYGVEYYFPGAYNVDFSTMFLRDIGADVTQRVIKILSRLLVTAWAESKRNMLVDIQGLLRDNDFKATPNNQILTAKNAWIEKLGKQNNADQTKLSWYLRYSAKKTRYTK